MSNTFKPIVSKKLVENLQQQQPIQTIVEVTGFSLKKILKNFTIEVPEEYIPGLGWVITWSSEKIPLKKEHIDLVQTALKFAWLYLSDSKNELLQSFVARELTMFEAGVRLEKERLQKSKAGGSKKYWKSLRAWIRKKLNLKRKWTHVELWYVLPEEKDGEEFYIKDRGKNVREDGIICCALGKRSPISFRGFEDNIRAVKKEKISENRRSP